MKMFLEHQVPPADPRKKLAYDYFRSNLEDILAAAKGSGARVLLSTVAVNLKDCAPFASQQASALDQRQKDQWKQAFEAGMRAQQNQELAGALTNYEAAGQIDASFAELQFRWAECYLNVTNLEQARRHFELARDDDALPFRADSTLNSIIAEEGHK